jgi:hypothetical protein
MFDFTIILKTNSLNSSHKLSLITLKLLISLKLTNAFKIDVLQVQED